jgi:hypothetical protein
LLQLPTNKLPIITTLLIEGPGNPGLLPLRSPVVLEE